MTDSACRVFSLMPCRHFNSDLVDALMRQDWPEVSDVSMMLNSPCPDASSATTPSSPPPPSCTRPRPSCSRRSSCASGCARPSACTSTCTRSAVRSTSSSTCSPRRKAGPAVAIVRRIPLTVTSLQTRGKVRPMPGIWVQSVPVTAIPWGGHQIIAEPFRAGNYCHTSDVL